MKHLKLGDDLLRIFCLCIVSVLFASTSTHASGFAPSLLRLLKTDASNLESAFRPVVEGVVEEAQFRTQFAMVAKIKVRAALTPVSVPEEIAVISFPSTGSFPAFKEGEEILLFLMEAPPVWYEAFSSGSEKFYAIHEGFFGKYDLRSTQGQRVEAGTRSIVSALGEPIKNARLAALKQCYMGLLRLRDNFLSTCAVEDLVSHPELSPYIVPEDSKAIRDYVVEEGKSFMSTELLRLFVPLRLTSEEDIAFLRNLSQSKTVALSPENLEPSLAETAGRVLERLNHKQGN